MRTLLIAAVVVVIGFKGLGWFFSPPADSPTHVVRAEPLVTVAPTSTPMPQPTPTLAQLGKPARVQFTAGTYGTTLTTSAQTTYVLWARSGQVMTLSSEEAFNVRMTAPSGADVPFENLRATLPANGDYLLTVVGGQAFTFSIDIR